MPVMILNSFLAALALTFLIPAASADSYCCKDAKGAKVCSDTLPPACYDRAYTRYGKSGASQVDAPLSAEERAKKEDAEKAKRIAERKVREQQLQDNALMARYPSEKDVDVAMEQELSSLQSDLDRLNKGLAAAISEKKAFEENANNQKLSNYASQVRIYQVNIDSQQKAADAKSRDIQNTKAKYIEDRQRLQEILKERSSLYEQPRQ